MIPGGRLGGVWSAVLTPVDDDLRPDAPKAIRYYRDLLDAGCDGINALGTTGEAMSFGAGARLGFMEALASGELPMDRVMAGTGAAALDDAVRLTRAAFDLGFAAALIMPPYFYRGISDDGVLRYFDALFARSAPPPHRVLLYNFPAMSGITFHPALVSRITDAFPGIVAGLKDSSNDAALQTGVLARHPEFVVFPGAESDLLAAKAYGAAGCISGSVALWPQPASAVWHDGDAAAAQRLRDARAALAGPPLIAAVRYLTAVQRCDPTWERSMPPLVGLTAAQKRALDAR